MKNLLYTVALALLLITSKSYAADPKISDVTAEVKKHDDGKQYVVINYTIANVPTDGIIVDFEANCDAVGDTASQSHFIAKPNSQELTGDVGLITKDGKKTITWEDEDFLVRMNKQAKYRCTAKLTMQGSDNTLSAATLNIQSYQASGWNYFSTGLVRMTIEKKLGLLPEFLCSQLGGNWADIPYQQGATFYKVSSVTDFPLYLGRNAGDKFKGAVSNTGCSYFLAIRDYGKPTQKVWANFARRFVQTQDVNGTSITQDFEFQFRYSSTVQSGTNLVVGNAGKQGQQSFTQLNTGDKFDFHLEVGTLGEAQSNTFEIEVPRREWKYFFNGKHIFTLSIPAKEGSFQGAGPGKISLKDATDASIGAAVGFSGSKLEIDTTPNKCFINFIGEMKALGNAIVNQGASSSGTTLNLAENIVFSSVIKPINAFESLSGCNVGLQRLRVTGDPGSPNGVLFDILVNFKDVAEGCEPSVRQGTPSGLQLKDVGVNPAGEWLWPASVQLNNIGLFSSPDWCLKLLSITEDKANNAFIFDSQLRAPLFDDVRYYYRLVKNNPVASTISVGSSSAVGILPIPKYGPGHLAEWHSLQLDVATPASGPKLLTGTARLAARQDWSSVSYLFGMDNALANKLKGFTLFEIGGKLKGDELGTFSMEGDFKLFGKSDSWSAKLNGLGTLRTGQQEISLGFDAKVNLVQLGGADWFFTGDAKGSLTIFPSWGVSMSATGDVLFPDLFRNNPDFAVVSRKLQLPQRLAKVRVMLKDTKLSCDLDFGWLGTWAVWVDLAKNPYIESKDFIGLQTSGVLNILQIASHQSSNGIQAVDTTFYPFTTKSARYAYAQIASAAQPQTFLVSPSQKVYTGTASDSSVIFSPAESSSDVGLWVLRAPVDGQWKLGVIGKKNGDSISIWQFNKPKSEFSYTATNVGRNIYCTWNSNGLSDSSTIDFFLDTDTVGYDGYHIGSAPGKSGVFNFTLSDSLSNCGYYVYAQRWDGDHASALLYAPNYFVNAKAALAAPLNRSGSYNLKNIVTLKWTASPDTTVRFYVLHARNANGIDSAIATVDRQLTEYSFNIDNPGSYQFSIQSYGANLASGCPAVFNGVVLAVDDERGDLTSTSELSANPNPTSQHITLRYNTEDALEHADIIIVNSLGQRVCEYHNAEQGIGSHELRLDVSSLPSDLYFVHLNRNNRILSTRFTVIR